jgi:hypothetical protein
MERLKSLDPPHKGLRNALSKITLLAGKTNYMSKESVDHLKSIGSEVFKLLQDHSKTEDKYILAPLEIKNPGYTSKYLGEHDEFERFEQSLEEKLMSFNGMQSNEEGHAFYLGLCEFQSEYLKHLDFEDLELESEMQKYFSDEELMEHQIQIMQAMDFDMLLLWFKYIVPARRADENAQVLTGFKSAVPEEVFNLVLDVIRKEINETELKEIMDLIK